ncbi:acyl carrier protein [Oxalobacteraceae bacterium]|nr:acyl carrier protein [Oxalobacteraceae bacterium]
MTQVSLDQLKEMARELLPNALAGLDDFEERDLIELGFDSLAMMQLFGAIEQRFDLDIFGMVTVAEDYRTLLGLHRLCAAAAEAAAELAPELTSELTPTPA